LRQAEAHVQVIMTGNAREFVSPLTFQTVSNQPVVTEMFTPLSTAEVAHVSVADKADLVAVAPATANVIAKFACGLADDFLSTAVLATKAPVLIAPAMNVNMFDNPATQENLRILRERGFFIVGPAKGALACGWEGKGRMSEVREILHCIKTILSPNDLERERILVTAGPTREPIDPVRFITNRSSGKMGYALAQAARMRGAEVTLITGPTDLSPPAGVTTITVQTASQMFAETMERHASMDTVIMAAAVSDFCSPATASKKIKKKKDPLTLSLVKTPDILEKMGKERGSAFLVGFAAETDNLLANARKKLKAKKIDLMVANDVTKPGAGFDEDTNIVTLLVPDGKAVTLPKLSKTQVAHKVLDRIMELKSARRV
jgi:phosphopantothenoylcysteine decarboxylase/phosphopantothenate--cysteine ligase